MSKILIADDDYDITQITAAILTLADQFYEIETAFSKEQLFAKIAEMVPDLVSWMCCLEQRMAG